MDERLFEDICISDVTIISGIRPAGRTTDYSTNGRRQHGILYIWSGEAQFFYADGRKIRGGSNELLFIPKDCRYKMQYTAPDTTFVLIDLELFDKAGKDIFLSEDIDVLAGDDCSNRIASIMANLELCGSAPGLVAALRRKELVYKLLGTVYEMDSVAFARSQKDTRIFAGVLLLEQSYLENIPIAKFAEASNISLSLFRSLFGKQYGMSPVQYRNRLRIDRAAAILSEGSCTVAEVAYACGFENIGYFCRYYKKLTGETPLETKLRNS